MIRNSSSALLFFNKIVPNQGYGGQRIEFYGATFSPGLKYYARFGKLKPTPLIYLNPGLLEGLIPEWDKIGSVSVSIVTEEGHLLCLSMCRFVYISHDCKNA